MPANKPATIKRVTARTAMKAWGAFVNFIHGGRIYAINNQVAIPYRWLRQQDLNEHPINALDTVSARYNLPSLTREETDTITVITSYARNRINRTDQGTWTELPDLQGLHTASASAIRSRSWIQLTTWIQVNNGVLVTTRSHKTPQAAIVPPSWVDARIDQGAPDVAQEQVDWNSYSSLTDIVDRIAQTPGHTHIDLVSKHHTVTVVDMDWLRAATGLNQITSTRRLPWSVAHPAVDTQNIPQVALVSPDLAASLLKSTTAADLIALPKSTSIDPEQE